MVVLHLFSTWHDGAEAAAVRSREKSAVVEGVPADGTTLPLKMGDLGTPRVAAWYETTLSKADAEGLVWQASTWRGAA